MKKDINFENLLRKPTYDYEKFHARTKLQKVVPNLNPKYWPEEWITIYYKGYSRFEEIKLPQPSLRESTSLVGTLLKRQSTRNFSKDPVKVGDLSNLLYFSAGTGLSAGFSERRFYPSPGGRYPLEVYLISTNSQLPKAVYHYYVKNHSLERLCDFRKKNLKKLTAAPFAKKASILIVITAIFKRNTIKYGDRGYRHVMVEAGHMAQNFYLLASALDLGICGIGGYVDDNINKLLDVDGLDETVIYLLALGNKVSDDKN